LNSYFQVTVDTRLKARRLGSDRMVGPLGVVVSPFRPTSREMGGTAPPRWGGETLVLSSEAAPAPTQADPMLQPTFFEVSPHLIWSYGPIALSPLLWAPEVQAVCERCSSSSLSFSAESLALVHGLEWCYSHRKSCHFQSALFLTDSQSALTLLSSVPAFLQPKSFWDIWDLSDSLSSRVALKLPVGPRSCWTSRRWMGRLARQTRSNTLRYSCSLPTGTDHCKD